MAWASPQFSRRAVDRAGRALVESSSSRETLEECLYVINNWRSSHSFPLNTFQVGLRRYAKQLDGSALVAQRIKRLSSIDAKLRRFPRLNLSQMQDIGGCRAVVRDANAVTGMLRVYRESDLKHKLLRVDNYQAEPKPSGYRGIHLIYRYRSNKSETYNGLLVEIQIRSPLQHAWATAVETVGTFLKQSLKSSEGHDDWLYFFALMGSAIALRENLPLVPKTPVDRHELVAELRRVSLELDVINRLRAYGSAIRTLEEANVGDAHYFLMALRPAENSVSIIGYARSDLDTATAEYLEVEKDLQSSFGAEAVLVSVESITSLKRAYPNYFLDTTEFLKALRVAIAK